MDCYALGVTLLELISPADIPRFIIFYENYQNNSETDFVIKCEDMSLQCIADIVTMHLITNNQKKKKKISEVWNLL